MKRRTFVKNSTLSDFSIAAFGALNWNGKSFEGDNMSTSDILGPFYRPGSPLRRKQERMANMPLKQLFLSHIKMAKDGDHPIFI